MLAALQAKKSGRPKSFSQKLRNFSTFSVGRPDLQGQEIAKHWVGVLGHFGLRQPLALREIRENRKKKFNGARGTFSREIRPPEDFLPEIAQLFYTVCFDRPDPRGGKSPNTDFLGHFGLR